MATNPFDLLPYSASSTYVTGGQMNPLGGVGANTFSAPTGTQPPGPPIPRPGGNPLPPGVGGTNPPGSNKQPPGSTQGNPFAAGASTTVTGGGRTQYGYPAAISSNGNIVKFSDGSEVDYNSLAWKKA